MRARLAAGQASMRGLPPGDFPEGLTNLFGNAGLADSSLLDKGVGAVSMLVEGDMLEQMMGASAQQVLRLPSWEEVG